MPIPLGLVTEWRCQPLAVTGKERPGQQGYPKNEFSDSLERTWHNAAMLPLPVAAQPCCGVKGGSHRSRFAAAWHQTRRPGYYLCTRTSCDHARSSQSVTCSSSRQPPPPLPSQRRLSPKQKCQQTDAADDDDDEHAARAGCLPLESYLLSRTAASLLGFQVVLHRGGELVGQVVEVLR